MTPGQRSRFGEDLLGSGGIDPVDGPGANQPSVGHDPVLGGAAGDTSRVFGSGPDNGESVTGERPLAMEDGTGDHPLDDQPVGRTAPGNGHSPGVCGAVGIDSVDDVGPNDAGALFELGSRQTANDQKDGDGGHGGSRHGAESTKGLGRLLRALTALGVAVVVGAMAFAIFEPVQVLPRIRVAPGFSLVDQNGETFTSEDGRGSVTLYTFAPVECGQVCDDINQTLGEVGGRIRDVDLGGAEFRMVTVALDTSHPDALATAATVSGADGNLWRWVGGEAGTIRDVVGSGFGVYYDLSDDVTFDPVFAIVDGTGLVRGDYRYSTLVSDADRLTRHISLLGDELRNSDGAVSLLYEAAHVFLCYP